MKFFTRWLAVLLTLAIPAFSGSCTSEQENTRLLVLNAGSLVIPFAQVEKEYEELHPEIDLMFEGHGSIQVIRHITEIGDAADVAAVADYSLLPLLMYPATTPDGTPFADWHIRFTSNKLGIAFTPESNYADEINAGNWYRIFLRPDVNIGFSDPRLDAVGYRSLMLIQLAELYYDDDTIFTELISQNFNHPIRSVQNEGNFGITVPELLEAATERIYLRGFSVQLLALLESHQIDYAFEYKSVALQHNLRFIELPAEIDLSSEELADLYQRVTVKLDYQRFKTVNPVFTGLPIIYGVTIPRSAPHPEAAAEFLEFLLDENGQRILNQNFQPPILPAETDAPEKIPDILINLLK